MKPNEVILDIVMRLYHEQMLTDEQQRWLNSIAVEAGYTCFEDYEARWEGK